MGTGERRQKGPIVREILQSAAKLTAKTEACLAPGYARCGARRALGYLGHFPRPFRAARQPREVCEPCRRQQERDARLERRHSEIPGVERPHLQRPGVGALRSRSRPRPSGPDRLSKQRLSGPTWTDQRLDSVAQSRRCGPGDTVQAMRGVGSAEARTPPLGGLILPWARGGFDGRARQVGGEPTAESPRVVALPTTDAQQCTSLVGATRRRSR
jgi:hypothetical protein